MTGVVNKFIDDIVRTISSMINSIKSLITYWLAGVHTSH